MDKLPLHELTVVCRYTVSKLKLKKQTAGVTARPSNSVPNLIASRKIVVRDENAQTRGLLEKIHTPQEDGGEGFKLLSRTPYSEGRSLSQPCTLVGFDSHVTR